MLSLFNHMRNYKGEVLLQIEDLLQYFTELLYLLELTLYYHQPESYRQKWHPYLF